MIAVLALLAPAAHAASCCGGSSAAVPTRPADCDHWVVGLGVTGETALGRWDGEGQSVASNLAESTVTATLGGGYRWAAWGGATAELPVQVNWKTTADTASTGGGLGDAHLSLFFDPIEERPMTAYPVPILSLGARLPTGTAWTEAKDPLLADVTGLPDPAFTGALSVEKANGNVPWSVGADLEYPLADAQGSPPTLGLNAALGYSFGGKWVVVGMARHVLTPGDAEGPARTSGGLRVIRNEPRDWRAWLGVESDIAAPGLGRSNLENVRASVGFLFVR